MYKRQALLTSLTPLPPHKPSRFHSPKLRAPPLSPEAPLSSALDPEERGGKCWAHLLCLPLSEFTASLVLDAWRHLPQMFYSGLEMFLAGDKAQHCLLWPEAEVVGLLLLHLGRSVLKEAQAGPLFPVQRWVQHSQALIQGGETHSARPWVASTEVSVIVPPTPLPRFSP